MISGTEKLEKIPVFSALIAALVVVCLTGNIQTKLEKALTQTNIAVFPDLLRGNFPT
jgi:hypothetical protein